MNTTINESFLKKIAKIAIPVTLQNVISSSLGIADVIMIGSLGSTAITAAGVANKYYLIYILAIFGLCSGAQIFLAQFWGDKNLDKFHKAMGATFIPASILILIFMIPASLAPRFIISLFSDNPKVISLGAEYLQIVSFSYPIFYLLQLTMSSFRSVGNAVFPMLISSISLLFNTIMNYLLIHGNFGFPQLGVKGAGIATVLSNIFGLFVMIIFLFFSKNPIKTKIKNYFTYNFDFFKMIFFKSLPITLNEMLWASGYAIYGMAFSKFSKDAFAAYEIFVIIQQLVFTFGIGLAFANTITLGNMLGANEIESAIDAEKKIVKLTFIVSIISGVLLFLTSDLITFFFKVEPHILENAKLMMRVGALFLPLKFYTLVGIVGTMRAGGDSLASVTIDLSTMFFIGVPMAFISLHFFNVPIYLAVGFISSEEFVKTWLTKRRIKTNKWAKNLSNI